MNWPKSIMSSVGTKAPQWVWSGPNTGSLAPRVRQRMKKKPNTHPEHPLMENVLYQLN